MDVDTLQKAADAYLKIGLIEKPLKIRDYVAQDLLPGK